MRTPYGSAAISVSVYMRTPYRSSAISVSVCMRTPYRSAAVSVSVCMRTPYRSAAISVSVCTSRVSSYICPRQCICRYECLTVIARARAEPSWPTSPWSTITINSQKVSARVRVEPSWPTSTCSTSTINSQKVSATLQASLSGTFLLEEGCRKPVLGVGSVPEHVLRPAGPGAHAAPAP